MIVQARLGGKERKGRRPPFRLTFISLFIVFVTLVNFKILKQFQEGSEENRGRDIIEFPLGEEQQQQRQAAAGSPESSLSQLELQPLQSEVFSTSDPEFAALKQQLMDALQRIPRVGSEKIIILSQK